MHSGAAAGTSNHRCYALTDSPNSQFVVRYLRASGAISRIPNRAVWPAPAESGSRGVRGDGDP